MKKIFSLHKKSADTKISADLHFISICICLKFILQDEKKHLTNPCVYCIIFIVGDSVKFSRSPFTPISPYIRRHSQVVRQRSAKPLFPGSSPGVASMRNLPFYAGNRKMGGLIFLSEIRRKIRRWVLFGYYE